LVVFGGVHQLGGRRGKRRQLREQVGTVCGRRRRRRRRKETSEKRSSPWQVPQGGAVVSQLQ